MAKDLNIITVRIENSYILISEWSFKQNSTTVRKVRRFPLPEKYDDGKFKSDPLGLATFIDISLANGKIKKAPIELLIGGGVGFFSEYAVKSNKGQKLAKRRQIEAEKVVGRKINDYIIDDYPYSKEPEESNMYKRALTGVEDKFLRKLIKGLKKRKLQVVSAGDALTVFSKNAASVIKTYRNKRIKENLSGAAGQDTEDDGRIEPLKYYGILDLTEKRMRAAIFDSAGVLVHLEDTEYVPNDVAKILELTEKYKEQGIVILAAGDSPFVTAMIELLNKNDGLSCISIGEIYEEDKMNIQLEDELSGRGKLFGSVFPAIGIPPEKSKEMSYLYGGVMNRKYAKATTVICIAALILSVLLGAMMPAYGFFLEKERDANLAIVSTDQYSTARDALMTNRDLTSELSSYNNNEKILEGVGTSYSKVLDDITAELLYGEDTIVEEMVYDKSSGLYFRFTVSDLEALDRDIARVNEGQIYIIAETSAREPLGKKRYACEIKVTAPYSPEGGSK